ncbi:unnamed protein product, partial [Brassica rapa subsp. narinosa]
KSPLRLESQETQQAKLCTSEALLSPHHYRPATSDALSRRSPSPKSAADLVTLLVIFSSAACNQIRSQP